MGMLTQNYYNLLKLRSIVFFNSKYSSGSYQNNPSLVNVNTKDIIFTSFSSGLTINYSTTPITIGGSSNSAYNVCHMPFYAGCLMYGQPSSFNYYGFTGGHYIYFITKDFEESIDNQFTTDTKSYKAVSESVTQDGYSSSVNINYSRTDTTALYGLYIVYGFNYTSSSTPTFYVVYNHKFNNPITEYDFTIQLSFNIANGEINVS